MFLQRNALWFYCLLFSLVTDNCTLPSNCMCDHRINAPRFRLRPFSTLKQLNIAPVGWAGAHEFFRLLSRPNLTYRTRTLPLCPYVHT